MTTTFLSHAPTGTTEMPQSRHNEAARDLIESAAAIAGSARALAAATGLEERKLQRIIAGKTATVDVETRDTVAAWAREHAPGAGPGNEGDASNPSSNLENPSDSDEFANAGRGRIEPVMLQPGEAIPAHLALTYNLPAGLVRIPQVTVETECGDGAAHVGFEEVEGYVVYPEWQIRQEFGVEPSRVKEIRTRGSSMEPTIMPGQRLFVALWDGQPLQDGLVYVIHGPGGVQIKRLFIEPDHIHVWSDNAEAPRFRVKLEQWDRDYRVMAVALEINRKL